MLYPDKDQSVEFESDGFRDPTEPLPEHDQASSIVEEELDRYFRIEEMYAAHLDLIERS